MGRESSLYRYGALFCLGWQLIGCEDKGPALSLTSSSDVASAPDLELLDDSDARLGALTAQVTIHSAVSQSSPILGYLRAGAQVKRSENFVENSDCITGWYAIAPRGYVCTEKLATTDLKHPTLRAMSLQPRLDQALPWVYARTTKVTALFRKSERKGVELSGRIPRSTVMAIIGSWTAPDESREPQRLGLRTDGHFVRADDLKAASGSKFSGITLEDPKDLPVAFIVKPAVYRWKIDDTVSRGKKLQFHEKLKLTGRSKKRGKERYWATSDGDWVRHQDATVIRRRFEFPDFVTPSTRWLDISIITGSMTAYEGERPVYTTLVSVGRDRLGDPETSASTARGIFKIRSRHISRPTAESADALLDAPWALELENGQWLHATPRHDRFGIENSDGAIEVAPKDGAHLFGWLGETLPQGWHGEVLLDSESTPRIVVRK
ncbi:MAG: L,D-transpeptidase [Polyangiaceae bacterium]|nr:L,D-transpeptidase [Polyangiaceae bacterium]